MERREVKERKISLQIEGVTTHQSSLSYLRNTKLSIFANSLRSSDMYLLLSLTLFYFNRSEIEREGDGERDSKCACVYGLRCQHVYQNPAQSLAK